MHLDSSQQQRMRYDPVTGHHHPYPSHAAQYREFHGKVAWMYNPWTRAQRDARDIGSDVTGLLIASEYNKAPEPICCEPAKPSAPRVTPESVEANICSEYYFTAANGINGEIESRKNSVPYCYESSLAMLTFCVLVLRNGSAVTGESACVSRENFDAELGRKIARENAISKIWPLEGYLLRENLYHLSNTNANKGVV